MSTKLADMTATSTKALDVLEALSDVEEIARTDP